MSRPRSARWPSDRRAGGRPSDGPDPGTAASSVARQPGSRVPKQLFDDLRLDRVSNQGPRALVRRQTKVRAEQGRDPKAHPQGDAWITLLEPADQRSADPDRRGDGRLRHARPEPQRPELVGGSPRLLTQGPLALPDRDPVFVRSRFTRHYSRRRSPRPHRDRHAWSGQNGLRPRWPTDGAVAESASAEREPCRFAGCRIDAETRRPVLSRGMDNVWRQARWRRPAARTLERATRRRGPRRRPRGRRAGGRRPARRRRRSGRARRGRPRWRRRCRPWRSSRAWSGRSRSGRSPR